MKKRYQARFMVQDINAKVTPLCGQTFIEKLLEQLGKVQTNVQVIQYQWRIYPQHPEYPIQKLTQAILQQCQKGIKYQVILNNFKGSANLLSLNNTASRYLTEAGASVKYGGNGIITHSKLWILDNKITFIGSHNLSHNAISLNRETSVMIENTGIATEYRRYFDLIWGSV